MLASVKPRVYRPYGSAKQLLECRDREVMFSGPANTGKTRALLEKANAVALKYPGANILALRRTRISMAESVLRTYERDVIPGLGVVFGLIDRRYRHEYRYPNGSRIVVGGLDKVESYLSSEWDLILVFEAIEITVHDWETLMSRQGRGSGVMPYTQIIGDTNPGSQGHWIYQRWLAGQLTIIWGSHKDNPTVTTAYLEDLQRLSGARYRRLYLGEWVGSEGLVYSEFDPSRHVVTEMPEGWRSWRKFCAIDFGFTNPFVCLWFAVGPDEVYYVYRELRRVQTSIIDLAQQVRTYNDEDGVTQVYADPAQAQERDLMIQAGVYTDPAPKDVLPGIEHVQSLLKTDRLYLLNGASVKDDPLLVERRAPLTTIEELGSYMWEEAKGDRQAKEQPHKRDDHGPDALRYGLFGDKNHGLPVFRFL